MKIQQLYAVPLVECDYPNPAALCNELKAFFIAREDEGHRDDEARDTQFGSLYESRFDLFYWKDPELAPMIEFIHSNVALTVARLNGYEQQVMDQLRFEYHAWYHITREGGFQSTHNHPNASWSGIFCVDPGKVRDDEREGTVRFFDPRLAADMYSDPGNQNLKPPYRSGGMQIKHEAGKLWLFPSYLMHEVFPYFGTEPRIVVAFNCWLSSDQDRKFYD